MSIPKPPPDHCTILYFAAATSYTKKQYDHLPAPFYVSRLPDVLEERYPGIKSKVLVSCAITVNLDYVDLEEEADKDNDGLLITAGDEVAVIPPSQSQSVEPSMSPRATTVTYKTVGKLDIPLDIYLPEQPTSPPPVFLWFHGGGLLQGHRSKVPPHFLRSISKYNIALISADYRLAPQVGVQDIFEDVKDCIAFIRNQSGLVKHLDASAKIDTSRLAVSGSSAGGYLAFLAGLYVDPKPNVILPIYPITDPLGYFFTTPQPGPLFRDGGEVSSTPPKEALKAMLEEGNEAEVPAAFRDPKAEIVANNSPDSARNKMYGYMLAAANLAELLHLNVGEDSYRDPENNKWRVAKSVAAHGLPPTYVVHGDVDRAVGVDQADEVVGVCVGEGMNIQYERLQGKDHLFDVFNEQEDMEGMYAFMTKHLGAATSGKL
nr:hypothetical protein B0A51_09821 [Rachicladosporium sp. CCFEE 5018]